jgi:hypothetical protein
MHQAFLSHQLVAVYLLIVAESLRRGWFVQEASGWPTQETSGVNRWLASDLLRLVASFLA